MTENQSSVKLEGIDSLSFKLSTYLLDYKRFLIFIIPFFLIVFFLIFKMSVAKSKAEGDFLAAKASFAKWQSDSALDSVHLQTLKGVIKKHPELAAPYESQIIQKMLALGEEKKSRHYVENLLKRAANRPNSYFTKFSKSSLLIEKGEKATALERSIRLKEEMLSDARFREISMKYGSTLFAFNLLRIAMLSQALELSDKELVAWRELVDYAKWDSAGNVSPAIQLDPKAFDELLTHFTDKNLSLKDYIKYRESRLLAAE
ncbi:MAG: hypothetical protein S4CHLAM37_00870 [Chlamydiia bacterium]|nr:hypothetical protein [Chlamydiia bacterium]